MPENIKLVTMLLTEAQAAKLLNLSTRTLFTLRDRGGLPFLKIGHRTMYRLADLKRWIADRMRTAESD
jgi:excisionase family DNA binding protein